MSDDTETPTRRIMDHRRRRAQRWIAVGSFVYLVAQGGAVTAFALASGQREPIAAVISGLSPFFLGTNGMLVSVVLTYMGVSLIEKVKTGE